MLHGEPKREKDEENKPHIERLSVGRHRRNSRKTEDLELHPALN